LHGLLQQVAQRGEEIVDEQVLLGQDTAGGQVEDVAADAELAVAAAGIIVIRARITKGVYIVEMSNGKTKKVMVK
ncbi:MAG: hypothetical protein IKH14_07740, partial [Prevotella sp.]|nr:hypothetical protein [Prevotella sp.]